MPMGYQAARAPSRSSTRISNPTGGPAGRQQLEQPAAHRRQLTDVLATGPALLQVRGRRRALAPGERAERQLGGHVV